MFELLKTKCELNPTRKAIADKRLKIKKEAVSKAQISRKDGKTSVIAYRLPGYWCKSFF